MFVGGIVIDDQMQLFVFGDGIVDQSQEVDPVLRKKSVRSCLRGLRAVINMLFGFKTAGEGGQAIVPRVPNRL
jgi:hypothetical protein